MKKGMVCIILILMMTMLSGCAVVELALKGLGYLRFGEIEEVVRDRSIRYYYVNCMNADTIFR